MDLSGLGSTLPAGLADAERDMGDKFRAAALSITNLYKSSLSYTKQSYNVGYSSALADVLSTVQSSIGAGQDAEQTLSRLMDWADARQAAISAFAAEDTDDAPPPLSRRPTALSRPGMSHLSGPARPASAPVTGASGAQHTEQATPSSSRIKEDKVAERSAEAGSAIQHGSRMVPAPTVTSTPDTSIGSSSAGLYQATPASILSSSPMASPSNRHIFAPAPSKPPKSLPIRYVSGTSTSQRGEASTSATASGSSVPTSSFNPSLPHAGVPFVSFTPTEHGPAQNYPTGAKRPMLDGMEVDPTPGAGSAPAVAPVQTTPVSQGRSGGRSAKRRSLGNSLNNALKSEDGDGDAGTGAASGGGPGGGRDSKDRGDKKKGGRRHGHGHGHGAGAGTGTV
ncbi:hypothetical protein IAU60_001505 [Kwoniella sp. DSM 27419]